MPHHREYLLRRGEALLSTRIITKDSLKNEFLSLVDMTAQDIPEKSSISIMICAYGGQSGAALLGNKFINKMELYGALRGLKRGTRLSIGLES